MKIYLMRHEQRSNNKTHTGLLAPEGLLRSKSSTKSNLKDLGITHIYCSPFKRCLQTIGPYAEQHGLNINIDYRIHEVIKSSLFKNYNSQKIDEYTFRSYPVCSVQRMTINYPETSKDIYTRTSNFMNNVIYKHKNTDDVVLICTHMGVIRHILDTYSYIKMGDIIELNENRLKLFIKGLVNFFKDFSKI